MALFEGAFSPFVPFGSRMLSGGERGTDIAIVQAVYNLMLRAMNPPEGPIGQPAAVTGRYDAPTQDAVRRIQSYFGRPATGVADREIYRIFGQIANPGAGHPVYGGASLFRGSAGEDVTVLQNRLNCFRYAALIGRPADGRFDAGTAAAVRAFKQDAVANGAAGLSDNSIAGDGFYDASWLYTFAGGRAIASGCSGFDVVFVQVLLARLGLYSGRITGCCGAVTRAAIRAFQRMAGLPADGIAGPATFYRLGLENALPAPNPFASAWP